MSKPHANDCSGCKKEYNIPLVNSTVTATKLCNQHLKTLFHFKYRFKDMLLLANIVALSNDEEDYKNLRLELISSIKASLYDYNNILVSMSVHSAIVV